MALTTSISRIVGAAALAVTMGVAAISATPAQAAGFQFNFGQGTGPSFSFGLNNGRPDHGFPGRYCLSDRQLRGAIERQGYRQVRVDSHSRGNWVRAQGVSRGWLYRLTVNACNGDVVGRDRLRRS